MYAPVYLSRCHLNMTDIALVHLERLRYIPETVVRFWVAELSSALEYLHRQRIIHRFVFLTRRSCGNSA